MDSAAAVWEFFKFLLVTGIDDYEDPNNPIPSGYVQIMTIHESKGLEFPVVVVGSLSKKKRTVKQIDRDLSQFYHRPQFEPEDMITDFDAMRHFYVAFSRAEKLLVLTTSEDPEEWFVAFWHIEKVRRKCNLQRYQTAAILNGYFVANQMQFPMYYHLRLTEASFCRDPILSDFLGWQCNAPLCMHE